MDAELIVRLAGTAVSLVAGAGLKHRTRVDQKTYGPAANVGIGAGAVEAARLLGIDVDPHVAIEIAATTEFVYQGGRSVIRGARRLGGLLRRLF